jgi:hypothetical protein
MSTTAIKEPPAVPAKFMRPRRYAERVGINWRTCYRYIDLGIFPGYKFQGVLLLDVDECDSIIRGLQRRVEPRKPKARKKP